MRLRRRMSPSEGENVLPLINVVFLLLVFFMVAGALERADIYDIEPPQSASEAETDAGENVLLMASDGRLALDGVALDRADLADALSDRIDEPLRLKADADADALDVVALLEDLRAAGVKTVTLLATEQPQ